MPYIDFIEDSDYYNRLGSSKLYKTKTDNKLKIGDCKVSLNNTTKGSGDCGDFWFPQKLPVGLEIKDFQVSEISQGDNLNDNWPSSIFLDMRNFYTPNIGNCYSETIIDVPQDEEDPNQTWGSVVFFFDGSNQGKITLIIYFTSTFLNSGFGSGDERIYRITYSLYREDGTGGSNGPGFRNWQTDEFQNLEINEKFNLKRISVALSIGGGNYNNTGQLLNQDDYYPEKISIAPF